MRCRHCLAHYPTLAWLRYHQETAHPIGDMQWKKADGTTGEYLGPLVPLGFGIPRKTGDWGIRRAIYDFALGYVSGFPVRDIVPFCIRSLFPQRTIPIVNVPPPPERIEP